MNKKKAKSILHNLKEKKIEDVFSGGSNGSIVLLSIGAEEYTLFVYCAWRISFHGTILATWRDNNEPSTGKLTLETKKLAGGIIDDILVSELSDIKFKLEDGKVFELFADMDQDRECENWRLADKRNNLVYTLNNHNEEVISKFR